jgi:hypothetical protein
MISRRVIRPLRHLGDLEAGSAAVATGYDPLMADEPALSLAASVTQRMTMGRGPARRSGAWAQAVAPRVRAPR